jgi:hypothetical protein
MDIRYLERRFSSCHLVLKNDSPLDVPGASKCLLFCIMQEERGRPRPLLTFTGNSLYRVARVERVVAEVVEYEPSCTYVTSARDTMLLVVIILVCAMYYNRDVLVLRRVMDIRYRFIVSHHIWSRVCQFVHTWRPKQDSSFT